MRQRGLAAAVLMVALEAAPAWAELPARGFDERGLTADVTAALEFIAPRTLEKVGTGQLALAGLRGLSLLDPSLIVQAPADRGGALVLSRAGGAPLLRQAVPEEGGADAWAALVVQVARAAWGGSEPVRRAGSEEVEQRFFDALFAGLDPYSHYLSPRQARIDQKRRAGRAGVGLIVAAKGDGFVVRAIEPGGAAAQAGIRAGEVLTAVDGQPVKGATVQAVAALLAGPEETPVSLTLQLRGRVRTVELVRSRGASETVAAWRDGAVVVIRVSGFSRNTASRLTQELIRITDDNTPTDGMVLDLRGNRGGVLQQAVASAAMLQGGGVVMRTVGRHQDAAHLWLADGRDILVGLPVVVLIDEGTASAAESLAASLADQRRAVVVGSVSLGKGLVQAVTTLPGGGEIFVSWSMILAPRGWSIQSLGVLPQLCTSLGTEQTARQLAALAHGEQLMAAALAQNRMAGEHPSPILASQIRAACPPRPGSEADLAAARALIATPASYAAALLRPEGSTAQPAAPRGLTGGAPVSN